VHDEVSVQVLLAQSNGTAELLGVSVRQVAREFDAGRAIADWADSVGAKSILVSTEVTERAQSIANHAGDSRIPGLPFDLA